MKIEKMAEAALGIALILPFEDAPTAGLSTPITAVVGAALIADAFGFKL